MSGGGFRLSDARGAAGTGGHTSIYGQSVMDEIDNLYDQDFRKAEHEVKVRRRRHYLNLHLW